MRYFLLILIALLIACSNEKEERDRFLRTYKEILFIRETVSDTLEANNKVIEAMRNNGYSEEQFREKYFDYAKNPQEFIVLLDSLRELVSKEVSEIQMKQDTTKKE